MIFNQDFYIINLHSVTSIKIIIKDGCDSLSDIYYLSYEYYVLIPINNIYLYLCIDVNYWYLLI